MNRIEQKFKQAHHFHQLGNLPAAQSLYEEVLRVAPNHLGALNLLGTISGQAGNYTKAAQLLAKLVRVDSGNAVAFNNLGLAQFELGRWQEALQSFNHALRLQRDYAVAYYNRGNTYLKLKDWRSAIENYDRALALRGDFAGAYSNRGLALREVGDLEAALASHERALLISTNDAVVQFNYGNALVDLLEWPRAIAAYGRAIALRPDYADAYSNRANALEKLREWDAALADHERAIALQNDNPDAHFNHGNVLKALRRPEAALASYDRALALNPAFARAFLNKGVVLQELGRHDEALASYERAMAVEQDFAEPRSNRGDALGEMGRWHDAIRSYDEALAIRPDFAEAHTHRAMAHLLLGDFERGWQEFEWRWRHTEMSTLARRRDVAGARWTGIEPLAGKTIFIYFEQGYGDTLQFCRYATLLAARGAQVILEVPRPLVELLKSLHGVSRLLADGEDVPPFDYHSPLMSLPLAFKTDLATIPSTVPYLGIAEEKRQSWDRLLGPRTRPRVGLVWSGGFRPDQPEVWAVNDRRNIPLAKLAALNIPGIDFYSLQKGQPAETELAQMMARGWHGPPIIDLTHRIEDFSDTAALIDRLDLVIAVDTSIAHLAGALAKPVWILNRFDTCWRWLLNRSDSPWYPTARLYRQERPADWDGVVQHVAEDLGLWARTCLR